MGGIGGGGGGGGGGGAGGDCGGLGVGVGVGVEEPMLYGVCQGPSHGEMVGCDNEDCEGGEWFHYACVGLTQAPEGEWFCHVCTEIGFG
jgi:hypothetical protein